METKPFVKWWNENNPDDTFPTTEYVNAEWFVDRGLPMIVECSGCTMSMALPNAEIDEDGYVFCSCCAE